uniref:Uncharacterized protein n=1 Tax=Trichogramma kaykai TaxID=54128 RepID=A0ABD2XCI0_9HYME
MGLVERSNGGTTVVQALDAQPQPARPGRSRDLFGVQLEVSFSPFILDIVRVLFTRREIGGKVKVETAVFILFEKNIESISIDI